MPMTSLAKPTEEYCASRCVGLAATWQGGSLTATMPVRNSLVAHWGREIYMAFIIKPVHWHLPRRLNFRFSFPAILFTAEFRFAPPIKTSTVLLSLTAAAAAAAAACALAFETGAAA
jgi:hypothetical protein